MTVKASASVRVNAASSGAIYAQMMANATSSIAVRSITLVARTPGSVDIGLLRSLAVGTATAGNVATGVAHRAPNQTRGMQGAVEMAWASTAMPTCSPTGTFFRRETFAPAATGARLELWRVEDDPIAIEPTGVGTGMAGLLLMNVGSAPGPALDLHVTWEYGPAADR